jgi:hypothetical protein
MFKHLLIVGAIAVMPVAAMADYSASDNADTHTVYVQAGQGYGISLAIPEYAPVQAPYALTGTSNTAPQDNRVFEIGQGGVLQFESQ